MSAPGADIEALLSRALAPVDPPEDLSSRLESTLVGLTEMAVIELEGWELVAMRDPRNWVRPVLAAAVGLTAGTALVILRVRAGQKRRVQLSRGPADLAARTARAVAGEARRVAGR
jgi:hypothetical protein